MKQIFSAIFLVWPAIAISAQINQSINIKTEDVKFEVKGDYTLGYLTPNEKFI